MFHKVNFTCSADEVRHVRIACRCGQVTVHDLPIALERSEVLVTCPKCGSAFIIWRADLREGAPNNGFLIRRLGSANEVKISEVP